MPAPGGPSTPRELVGSVVVRAHEGDQAVKAGSLVEVRLFPEGGINGASEPVT